MNTSKARDAVVAKITEEDSWGDRVVKEEALDELDEAAGEEGCEWGEQTPNIIALYRALQPDYCSKEFAKALYEEIINLYMHMLAWTEVVESPEKEETVKHPSTQRREWCR